jgi:hypothetical protein
MKLFATLWCLLLLHSSDNNPLSIESTAISVLKPALIHHDHVTRGTQTIVYTSAGKTFGVRETYEDITRQLKVCDKGG